MSESDGLGHHCGVIGMFSTTEAPLLPRMFFGLYSLQHRGQEAAGVSFWKEGIRTVKGGGLVFQVLQPLVTDQTPITAAIGHTRYSTAGGSAQVNAQPIHIRCNRGEIAIAHNGNISNIHELRQRLYSEGAIFQTTSDTEVIVHLLSRVKPADFEVALQEVLGRLNGAFSLVLLFEGRLYVVRDPHGFRPLYYGQREGLHLVASETCAFSMLSMEPDREVRPGEILIFSQEGVRSIEYAPAHPAHCVFELIYFSRPDSEVFRRSVYQFRKLIGKALAAADPIHGDLVMPVPDSGNTAALGYAEAKGIPFELGLTRNHFSGRSFTLPIQEQRELMVRMKLHPIREVIHGKRIVLVDDSLVRGTTSKILVKLLREAGAAEIHLRLSAPEIKYPCFYGIDMPTRRELISNRFDPARLAGEIGADSVLFLPLPELKAVCGDASSYCFACFDGRYPERLDEVNRREVE